MASFGGIEIGEASARETQAVARFNGVPFIARDGFGAAVYDDRYLNSVRTWCDGVYDTATAEMAEDEGVRSIRRYIDYIQGIQWPEGRPKYRPAPVVNRVSRFWWDNVAALTDVKLNMEVRTENQDYKNRAELLTRLMQANYQRDGQGALSLIFAIMHATLSMGYMKVGYSASKDDVVMVPCGTDSVFPILGCLSDFQESYGVTYRVWKPITWFQERFPAQAPLIRPDAGELEDFTPDKPWGMDTYTWNAIAPGLRDYLYSKNKDYASAWDKGKMPVALYTEFWFKDSQINTSGKELVMGEGNSTYIVKPGERVYPYGRMISTANRRNRIILQDRANWHWHASFPFAPLRLSPVPWSWTGMSEFRDLLPLQDSINKVMADGLSLLNQATNKIMVTKEGSISDATWENYFPGMPAAKIKLLNRSEAVGNQIQWIGPDIAALNAVPQFHMLLKQDFDEQTGNLDMNRLAGKKQVPSFDSIQEIRDTQQGRYRIKGVFLESFFSQVGSLTMSDIVQYYTRKKIISSLGADGLTWDYFDYDPDTMVPADPRKGPYQRGRDFIRQFAMYVAAGTALPSQRQKMAQDGMMLWKMQAIDLEGLYKILSTAGYSLPPSERVESKMAARAGAQQ